LFYTTEQLTARKAKTPEGFLICYDVPIARAGLLEYAKSEYSPQFDALEKEKIIINRDPSALFNAKTISSFEGKSVTYKHPAEFITAENWREYTVGVTQNVRGDGTLLLADLMITCSKTIQDIDNGLVVEISCGYNTDTQTPSVAASADGDQINIIGNHVALCAAGTGRCGEICAIRDTKNEVETVNKETWIDKMTKVFRQSLDEMPTTPEEKVVEKVDADPMAEILAKLDSILARLDEAAKVEVVEKEAEVLDVEEEIVFDACKIDSVDLSRAEILAPSLSLSASYKKDAVLLAYNTTDGKAVIDQLLGSTKIVDAKHDEIFIAAAELLKLKRSGVSPSPKIQDEKPALKPNQLNAHFATFWNNK
jgi:hypothetical protein